MPWKSVLTPGITENFASLIASMKPSMSRGFGIRTPLAPTPTGRRASSSARRCGRAAAPGPRTSRPGSTASGMNALNCSVLATRLRWVSTAPLERPVVPPVYWKNRMSSPVSATGSKRERPRPPRARRRSGWRRSSRGSTAGEGIGRPMPSPRSTVITVLTGVWSMISASAGVEPPKMMMVSTPASFSWCAQLARGVERVDVHLRRAGADGCRAWRSGRRRRSGTSARCGRRA